LVGHWGSNVFLSIFHLQWEGVIDGPSSILMLIGSKLVAVSVHVDKYL